LQRRVEEHPVQFQLEEDLDDSNLASVVLLGLFRPVDQGDFQMMLALQGFQLPPSLRTKATPLFRLVVQGDFHMMLVLQVFQLPPRLRTKATPHRFQFTKATPHRFQLLGR
jgi:hypothetical protein